MTASENIKSKSSWVRGFYILLFALLYSIAEVVLGAIVLYQFGSQLLTASPNSRLLEFTRGLNAYMYQILQYISYRSEEQPYPFSEWPAEGLPCEDEMDEEEESTETEADAEEEEAEEADSDEDSDTDTEQK